jgi:hypothetical protein
MLRPVAIEKAWPQIEPFARDLLLDPDENSAEDLLRDCIEQKAVVLQADDGFLITTVKVNPHTGLSEYHVRWGSRVVDEAGCFERIIPELNRAARHVGCANIVFDSNRPGWMRKAVRAGFRLRNAEYVRVVE